MVVLLRVAWEGVLGMDYLLVMTVLAGVGSRGGARDGVLKLGVQGVLGMEVLALLGVGSLVYSRYELIRATSCTIGSQCLSMYQIL